MGNLASVYILLERYADALVMQEKVLEFRRRVLPENHPGIGEGHVRSDVSNVCLLIVILTFTGLALYNISLNYQRLGKLPRALKCAREALRIWQTSLPPEHEDIAYAMALLRNLG